MQIDPTDRRPSNVNVDCVGGCGPLKKILDSCVIRKLMSYERKWDLSDRQN